VKEKKELERQLKETTVQIAVLICESSSYTLTTSFSYMFILRHIVPYNMHIHIFLFHS